MSGRGTSRVLAVAAVAATMAGACHHQAPQVARPYPAPTAAALTEALGTRQRAVGSMNARVRATSWLGGDRVRATVLMLVDRPGRLRFEAEVSLQGTVAVLATDGQRFAFLDAMKNELRRGPACPANVASLIRIPLGPADVAAILLGDLHLPDATEAQGATVEWDPARGADVLTIPRRGGWLRLLLQGAAGVVPGSPAQELRVVGAVSTDADGRVRWRVSYEDFTGAAAGGGRVSLPQTIRFAEGGGSFDEGVEIKFKERTLNEPPPADAFALAAPPGTAIIDVGCPPEVPLAGSGAGN